LVGWSEGWLVGWVVGWLGWVGWLEGWLVLRCFNIQLVGYRAMLSMEETSCPHHHDRHVVGQ